MDWAQILPSFFTGVSLVIVTIIETRNGRSNKRADARAARRAEESRLSMEMMSATCKLATVTAKAVTGHKTNGDVEEALDASVAAQDEYEGWKTRVAAQQVAKI